MKIDKFLSEALLGIAAGVGDANNKLGKKQYVIYNTTENIIEFDIAVTVSEGNTEVVEGSVGAGLNIFGFNFGGKSQSSMSDKSISRLKFKVKPREKID